MTQKLYTIEEAGIDIKTKNQSRKFDGMTPQEVFLQEAAKYPRYWLLITQEEGGPPPVSIPPEDKRPDGLFGMGKEMRTIREGFEKAGIPPPPIYGRLEAAFNAPGNAAEEGVATYDALRNYEETLGFLKDFGEGMARTGIRGIGTQEGSLLGQAINQQGGQLFGGEGIAPTQLDSTENMFRGGMGAMRDKLLDENEWRDRPVSNMLLATGLIPGNVFGHVRLATLLNALNPALQTFKATHKTGSLLTKGGMAMEAARMGVLSGRGMVGVRESYRALRDADPAVRQAFYKAMREENSLFNFLAMANDAVRQVREVRGENWRTNFPNLEFNVPTEMIYDDIRLAIREVINGRLKDTRHISTDLSKPIDVDNIPWKVMGILDEADAAIVKEWIRQVESPKDLMTAPVTTSTRTDMPYGRGFSIQKTTTPGEMDIDTFNSFRTLAWSGVEHIPRSHKSAQALMTKLYGETADILRRDIAGYGGVLDDFKKMTKMIEDFEDAMGLRLETVMDRAKARREAVKAVRNAVQALRDDPASAVSASLIRQMTEATGVPILPAAAGAMFSNWLGSGIISRSQLANLATLGIATVGSVAGHGAEAGTAAAVLMALNAPYMFPRAAANLVLRPAAFTGRQKDAILGIFKAIHEKVPEGWATDTMTFYQAAERLHEEAQRQAGMPVAEPKVFDFSGVR
jgi:hypothetical protein